MGEGFFFGLISDTHGLLRPEALVALRGSRLILHAGDVGDPEVLAGLNTVAPVRAVRGNVDYDELARLAATWVVELGAHRIYLIHDLGKLDLDPVAAGFAAVVSGHSHVPAVRHHRGVLYVNPGRSGPRRFETPVTVGRLHLASAGLRAELIELPG